MNGGESILNVGSRKHAAELVARKLMWYDESDAVVMAIPCGGVPVGFELAEILHLNFDIVPCKKVKHPSNHNRTIGSVSINDSYLGENCRDVPQDYIYHQIAVIQHALSSRNKYYEKSHNIDVKDKTVILTDDFMKTANTVLACVKSLRRLKPREIVLAIPVVNRSALRSISNKVDRVIFLIETSTDREFEELHHKFPKVSHKEVKDIVTRAKDRHIVYE